MKRVLDFLKKAEVYYLATVEGDQPRVRPFGTVNEFEGKLYIQTGKVKPTSKQLAANPKAEICAFKTGGVDGCDCEETLKLIAEGKLDTEPLITHTYPLAKIDEAHELFENKRDGVIKVAIKC